jgi:hypothetical protein
MGVRKQSIKIAMLFTPATTDNTTKVGVRRSRHTVHGGLTVEQLECRKGHTLSQLKAHSQSNFALGV